MLQLIPVLEGAEKPGILPLVVHGAGDGADEKDAGEDDQPLRPAHVSCSTTQ